MAKAADWLRQERRKVLGDWVAFCLGCGAARRWFEDFEADVPDTCLVWRQAVPLLPPAAPFPLAVVDCEECGEPVHERAFGWKIRRLTLEDLPGGTRARPARS
jgi:hypothetical protein